MKIKILAASFLAFVFFGCDKSADNAQTSVVTETNTTEIVTEPAPSPPAPAATAPETVTTAASTAAPEYMNLDMQGFGVPNTNLNSMYGEVIFLNHWGSWCGPCRMEMPSIQSLYDKYGDKVKFVMIATERRPGAHVDYIEKEGFTFPVYSMISPASTEIKPKGYPTTIILDRKGQIKTYDVGAADWNAPNVHEFLDKLIAEN